MKVFVAVPSGELSRYPEFWHSLQGLALPHGTQLIYGQARGVYVATNQNVIARQFLSTDAEYFWLVNDDQLYPPHTLSRLLAHDVNVCVPVCLGHDFPFKPLIYDHDAGDEVGLRPRYLDDSDRGLVQVVAAGGGGMLLKRVVFESIPDPWWEVHTARPPGAPPIQSTEDVDFCRKIRALGVPIWCDTDAVVGHQTVFTVWPYRDRDTRNWSTAISRGEDHVIIPAAREPSLIIKPKTSVTV
jgi:hypothetical protein